jgi:hypothetical protein
MHATLAIGDVDEPGLDADAAVPTARLVPVPAE